MDSKLENKLWWEVYNEVGVHPDDYSLDFSSREALVKSLKEEGLGDHPYLLEVTGEPEDIFQNFCLEAANNSIIVDKQFAYKCAFFSKEVKRLWEDCEPADAPQVDNEVLIQAERFGAKLYVQR